MVVFTFSLELASCISLLLNDKPFRFLVFLAKNLRLFQKTGDFYWLARLPTP